MSKVLILHNKKYRDAVIVAETETEILCYQVVAVANPVYVLVKRDHHNENSQFIMGRKNTGYVRTYNRNKLPKKWQKEITKWDC